MTLDPNVGHIPGNGSGLRDEADSKPTLQDQPEQNLPLSAAEERALELEAAQNESRLVERLRASENISSRRNACRASSICSGGKEKSSGRSTGRREASVWKPCWINFGGEPVRVGTGACCAASRGCGDGLIQRWRRQSPICWSARNMCSWARPTARIR